MALSRCAREPSHTGFFLGRGYRRDCIRHWRGSESRMRYLDSESPWRGRIVDAADDYWMLFGAAIAADMAGLSNSAIQQPLAHLDEPSIGAACFLVLASTWAARDVWRFWRAWPQGATLGQVLLASPYRLSAAAAVFGVSKGV